MTEITIFEGLYQVSVEADGSILDTVDVPLAIYNSGKFVYQRI